MIRTIIVAALAIWTTVLPVSRETGQSAPQKEIRTIRLHVDGVSTNLPSLNDIVARAEAVVVAQVQKARLSSVAPKGMVDDTHTLISTAYSARIVDFVVWPPNLARPSSFEVEIPGIGDIDQGTYIQRFESERFDALSVGGTYVLFLRQHALGRRPEAQMVWVPATGDNQSIIEVLGTTLKPQASTRLSSALSKKSLSELVDAIKAIAREIRH